MVMRIEDHAATHLEPAPALRGDTERLTGHTVLKKYKRKNTVLKISVLFIPAFFILPICLARLSLGDELIPPTRTLESGEKTWGKLTVFSEPPGFMVYLDNEEAGITPLWLGKVETGMHTVRIKDKEAEIYIEQGRRTKAGLFKESFIVMQEKEIEVAQQPGPEAKPMPEGIAGGQPTEEERKRELSRWDLFINGSLPFF